MSTETASSTPVDSAAPAGGPASAPPPPPPKQHRWLPRAFGFTHKVDGTVVQGTLYQSPADPRARDAAGEYQHSASAPGWLPYDSLGDLAAKRAWDQSSMTAFLAHLNRLLNTP